MLRLLVAGFLVLIVSAASADEGAMKKGRAVAAAFLSGRMDVIWQRMTPELQGALGSKAALTYLLGGLDATHGTEMGAPREDVQDQGLFQAYRRTSTWSRSGAQLVLQVSFDRAGRIAGFHIGPAPVPAESRFLDYQTKAKLRLPFGGAWFVYWGGREVAQNYHAVDRAQRFALDLLVIKDGISHVGNAAELANYYCWDLPILSPADATVVTVIDGLRDEKIGEGNPKSPAGNHVVLDLGNGEFGFLAHLRKGSVTVKPGDLVRAGQQLGSCGNSGNTTEPHLHFHLQNTPDLQDGEGLPVFFENYVADGNPVVRGEPLQGQIIAPGRQLPSSPRP